MMLKVVKHEKNDERIAIRLSSSIRQKLQRIASDNSSEEVKITESDVIREILVNALQDQQSENPQ